MAPLVIYYFGNEYEWNSASQYAPSKRRSCLYQALSTDSDVKRIYLVKRVSRSRFLKTFFLNLLKNVLSNDHSGNVFFTMLLPDRYVLYPLNRFIARLAVILQSLSGYFSHHKVNWCYWPYHYRDVTFLGLSGKQVFDVDHNIIDDPNTEDREGMVAALLRIGKESDLILSGVRSMISWYRSEGINQVIRLRNGVDKARFDGPIEKKYFLDRSKPVVGYCGTLSKWMDQDLFFNLVARNPQWTFVVIGMAYKNEALLTPEYPNLVWLGEQPASITPHYLRQFDVTLGLYQEGKEWLDVDSMKLYEYLAAGVPVVSTRFHKYLNEDFDDLIYLASSVNEFTDRLAEILSWGDSEKKTYQQKAKAFTKRHTWASRSREVIHQLKEIPLV